MTQFSTYDAKLVERCERAIVESVPTVVSFETASGTERHLAYIKRVRRVPNSEPSQFEIEFRKAHQVSPSLAHAIDSAMCAAGVSGLSIDYGMACAFYAELRERGFEIAPRS